MINPREVDLRFKVRIRRLSLPDMKEKVTDDILEAKLNLLLSKLAYKIEKKIEDTINDELCKTVLQIYINDLYKTSELSCFLEVGKGLL